jgi:hypothetical protein
MNKNEIVILNIIMDSLDRLYDKKTNAIDVYGIIFASSFALIESNYYFKLSECAKELMTVIQLNSPRENEMALECTEELRLIISNAL